MWCWNAATYKLKVHKGKIEIISLQINKAPFSTDPHMHCQLLGVGCDGYLNAKWAIFQLFSWQEQVTFKEMMTISD